MSTDLPGMGGDFAKGASGPQNVYDTSPTGLGISPAYLASSSASASAASSSGGFAPGDYKVSAQAADHADGSAKWLLCDGTAIDAAYADLIALVGATRPDARGRTLVMQGTNADVSTLLANDGQAVANRRPKHRTTNNLTLPDHIHNADDGNQFWGVGAAGGTTLSVVGGVFSPTGRSTGNPTTHPAMGGSVGTNNANDALDTPSYLVPGNLFIHT